MRTLLAIAALVWIGSFNVHAQTAEPSAADKAWVALNTGKLNVQLDLTDAQQTQVKDIGTRYVSKHEALENATPKLSEKEMSDKTAALMMERDRDLRAVLNADQYAKWDEMRQKGTGDLTEEKKEQMKAPEKKEK